VRIVSAIDILRVIAHGKKGNYKKANNEVILNGKRKRGKVELRDYLQQRHASLLHEQTKIEEEKKQLEDLLGIVNRIVEIKKK